MATETSLGHRRRQTQLDWLASDFQRFVHLCLSGAGITCITTPGFSVGAGDPLGPSRFSGKHG